MAETVTHVEPEPCVLSPDEGRAFFDQQARALVGMTGEEFLRRLDAGELKEQLEDSYRTEYLELLMLTPFVGR